MVNEAMLGCGSGVVAVVVLSREVYGPKHGNKSCKMCFKSQDRTGRQGRGGGQRERGGRVDHARRGGGRKRQREAKGFQDRATQAKRHGNQNGGRLR